MAQQKPEAPKEKDKLSGVETTGHEWDGLKELNNPAPRWWLIVWLVTIIWSVGYWVVYPAWPTISGHTEGLYGWSQHKELAESQAEITALRGEKMAMLAGKELAGIKADPALYEFAREAGFAAFKNNCAACHGTGGEGRKGFPNLNDDDWIWGGKLEDIHATIVAGIRSAHKDARQSAMPAFGRDGVLKHEEIEAVAAHVLSLSGQDEKNESGAKLYAENCAACHGPGGEGSRELGAPRLTDAIWLYGGDKKTVVDTISNSRAGMMPNWDDKLDAATIKALAIYVHSLGGGE